MCVSYNKGKGQHELIAWLEPNNTEVRPYTLLELASDVLLGSHQVFLIWSQVQARPLWERRKTELCTPPSPTGANKQQVQG